MNKTELIAAVAAKAELSKAAAANAVDAVLATIESELKAGNNVQLIGFGTFVVKEIPAHEGLNPAKGIKIQIPAANISKFSTRQSINQLCSPASLCITS